VKRAAARLEETAADRDPNLAERLRAEVPPFFVFSAVALFALTVVAVGVHISMGNFADYEGITLLQEELVVRSSLAQVPSSTRSMRLQGLAEGEDEEAEKDKEDEEEVIRFENDKKVGGGDLMVPISMVDYENLGEGSIVDQRYPRKLPGSDELEAEWNALWNWDWGSDDSAAGVQGGDDEGAAAPPPPPQEQAVKPAPKGNSKLEDMGVNVNGYHKSGKK